MQEVAHEPVPSRPVVSVVGGRGTVINIASVTALTPETFNGTYSGTKAFVLNFTQALHAEVGERGVRVQAVLPGGTRTEVWERAGVDLSSLPPERLMASAWPALSGTRVRPPPPGPLPFATLRPVLCRAARQPRAPAGGRGPSRARPKRAWRRRPAPRGSSRRRRGSGASRAASTPLARRSRPPA